MPTGSPESPAQVPGSALSSVRAAFARSASASLAEAPPQFRRGRRREHGGLPTAGDHARRAPCCRSRSDAPSAVAHRLCRGHHRGGPRHVRLLDSTAAADSHRRCRRRSITVCAVWPRVVESRLARPWRSTVASVQVAETIPIMVSRPASAPHRHSRRIALAALVLLTSGPLASRPSLQTVRLIAGNGETSVILSADGALPSPKVGVLTDPPRIYLDFPDVAAATEGTRVNGDVLVRGVRVAVNQSQPLVTRVVIDLARPAPYRIEAGLRDSGQLTIVVGVPVAPAGAAPPRPLGQAPAGSAPALPKPPPAEPPKAAAPAKAPATVPAVPAAAPAARTLPPASRPSLQTVRLIDVGDGEASVFLSADGALPSPEVGVLTDPPRIYLDFRDVAATTEGLRVNGDLLVRGVRVAVSQSQPLVTRVVIDLARPAPYRIEAGQRASGQLTVVVGVPIRSGRRRAAATRHPQASPVGASEGRRSSHGAGNGARRACRQRRRHRGRLRPAHRPLVPPVRRSSRTPPERRLPERPRRTSLSTCSEPHPCSNASNGSARCWCRSTP